MSALRLKRVGKGQGGQCCEPLCTRAGRYTIEVAGWFVMWGGLMSRKATLCKPCAEAERERWDELAAGPEVCALAALGGSVVDRTEALWFLDEEQGWSRDRIALALKLTGEGVAPDQILERLNADAPELQEVC